MSSAPRVKFQVWSDAQKLWRAAYSPIPMLLANITLMKAYGIKVRVGRD
jgi:hypothetical protein